LSMCTTISLSLSLCFFHSAPEPRCDRHGVPLER